MFLELLFEYLLEFFYDLKLSFNKSFIDGMTKIVEAVERTDFDVERVEVIKSFDDLFGD